MTISQVVTVDGSGKKPRVVGAPPHLHSVGRTPIRRHFARGTYAKASKRNPGVAWDVLT
jgi:hypothetical protein